MNTIQRSVLLLLSLVTTSCVISQPISLEERRVSAEFVDRGIVALRSADLAQAEALFLYSLEISPTAQAYDGLGCIAARRGDFDQSRRYLQSALKIDPSYGQAYATLAWIDIQNGHYREAIGKLETALRSNPKDPLIRNNLAVLQQVTNGEEDRAKVLFRQALELAPLEGLQHNLNQLE